MPNRSVRIYLDLIYVQYIALADLFDAHTVASLSALQNVALDGILAPEQV